MREIFERRSVRKFTAEPVTKEQLQRLLAAAMQAPSAGNAQAWEFIVVTDRAAKEAVARAHPYAQCVTQAPVAIVVCAATERERFEAHYLPQNCAAAVENLLLEAQHLGLGGVWLGVYPEEPRVEALRRIFSLPQSALPFAVVALGHPAAKPAPQNRYDEGKVHWESW